MNNKWSPQKVKKIQRWLVHRWPHLFAPRPDQVPLSLSIHKEILTYRVENPDLSCRVLSEALKRHVTGYGYLYGMLKNTHRHDLKGNRVEQLSSNHRKLARNTLRSKQKIAQQVRKEKRLQICAGGIKRPLISKPVADTMSEQNTVATRSSLPVIRYKQSRKKLMINREIGHATN